MVQAWQTVTPLTLYVSPLDPEGVEVKRKRKAMNFEALFKDANTPGLVPAGPGYNSKLHRHKPTICRLKKVVQSHVLEYGVGWNPDHGLTALLTRTTPEYTACYGHPDVFILLLWTVRCFHTSWFSSTMCFVCYSAQYCRQQGHRLPNY